MTNNLLEHVQEMTNDFERVITDHKSWHTNLGVPNWDVIKSHLLQSQLKSFELLKEELEGRMSELEKYPLSQNCPRMKKQGWCESCAEITGRISELKRAITLLDTIIQDIKLQIK